MPFVPAVEFEAKVRAPLAGWPGNGLGAVQRSVQRIGSRPLAVARLVTSSQSSGQHSGFAGLSRSGGVTRRILEELNVMARPVVGLNPILNSPLPKSSKLE